MTILTVAMVVSDANRVTAAAELSTILGETIGFIRPCCAANTPSPTWETPATHWYNHSEYEQDSVVLWQNAVEAAEEEDPLFGLIIFTSMNAENPMAWAVTNLASQGLMFVPSEE